ncbi:leucyl aminopeptidase [Allofrancisella guangzhouensis]|uniref:Probable cytosol aminopeptidase n=1 Tax=Allofrancisella guangzhouensis TaxID=594679 RepID=A0A0A8E5G9_9GAMM|nr:leucyl aminopeptidase [Allofrancisella guangzhouensis]AJC49248.1 cytochrome C oxidase subunit II [Allofrancisella guangzhouensis]MBK2027690.1 leucyl aminopeptidase [Allofrancisella guangzhouensis]MBK2044896.1 leucyl aminopeptidase [Allofrancisella guangzhouensis]MBK2046421.1 leucyl aminopeptidase [Allofrancisella guangzhouensis]
MKLTITDKTSLSSEVIIVAQENLQKLVTETKCPNSKKLLGKKVFKAKFGEVLPLLHSEKTVILLGIGLRQDFLSSEYDKSIAKACDFLKKINIEEVAINVDYVFENCDIKQFASETVRALISESYVFDELKTVKESYSLNQVELVYSGNQDLDQAVKIGSAIACGQNYAKDLQNLPANICNTDYMLNEARELTSKYDKFDLEYLDEDAMKELGMGCALAVGRGSDMPNYIVSMKYNGATDDQAPIVLVGKGLVFDSGGLCIKPAAGMDTMKMDMGGAAVVMGTMKTLAMLNLPVNVIGVMALAENAIDARSYRPGDVLKSMKGITVEVSNTDAEGRLVLCDTLTYVGKYKPKVVIDMATLTGAMIISLGDAFSGLFANSDKLANSLQQAAQASNDLVWRLPLHKPYLDKIKSKVADVDNCNRDRSAGSIVAALFLSKFTEDYEWAHLDIAGSAMGDFSSCKASGRPIPLLTHYLLSQAK